MLKSSKLFVAFFCLLTSVGAGAQNLQLGEPAIAGNGCPQGSATAVLSPDHSSLSILFDQYVAEAGSGRQFDRKTCSVGVPVQVPNGYSVAVIGIDYRGFVWLPRGGTAQLTVNYFLPGNNRTVSTIENFRGPTSRDYVSSNNLSLTSVVWTACGASTILRANTSMRVNTNPQSDDAMASVDSMDVNGGIIYHLAWRRCN